MLIVNFFISKNKSKLLMIQAVILLIITSYFFYILKYPHNNFNITTRTTENSQSVLITNNLIDKFSSIYSIPDSVFNKSYLSLYFFLKKTDINISWDYSLDNINKYNKIYLSKNLKDCNSNNIEILKDWIKEGGELVLFTEPNSNNLQILKKTFRNINFELIKPHSISFFSPFDLNFNSIIHRNKFLWYIKKSDKMIPYYCNANLNSNLFKHISNKEESIISSLLFKIPYFKGNIFIVSNPSLYNVENLQNNLFKNNLILKTIKTIKNIKLFYLLAFISILISYIILIKHRLFYIYIVFLIFMLFIFTKNISFTDTDTVKTAFIDLNNCEEANKLANILSRSFILVDRKGIFETYNYIFTDKEDFQGVIAKYLIFIDNTEKINRNNIINFISKH